MWSCCTAAETKAGMGPMKCNQDLNHNPETLCPVLLSLHTMTRHPYIRVPGCEERCLQAAGTQRERVTSIKEKNSLHSCLLLLLRYLKAFDSVTKLNDFFMTSLNSTTVVEIKEMIHDTVRKSFDTVITLNDILMTSPNCTTVVEVKENINDTIIMVSTH